MNKAHNMTKLNQFAFDFAFWFCSAKSNAFDFYIKKQLCALLKAVCYKSKMNKAHNRFYIRTKCLYIYKQNASETFCFYRLFDIKAYKRKALLYQMHMSLILSSETFCLYMYSIIKKQNKTDNKTKCMNVIGIMFIKLKSIIKYILKRVNLICPYKNDWIVEFSYK